MSLITEKRQRNYSKLFLILVNCNKVTSTTEDQTILNLLNESNDSKFVTRYCNIASDQSNANYSENFKKINADTVNASLNM